MYLVNGKLFPLDFEKIACHKLNELTWKELIFNIFEINIDIISVVCVCVCEYFTYFKIF